MRCTFPFIVGHSFFFVVFYFYEVGLNHKVIARLESVRYSVLFLFLTLGIVLHQHSWCSGHMWSWWLQIPSPRAPLTVLTCVLAASPGCLQRLERGQGMGLDQHQTWKYSPALCLYKTSFSGKMSVAHWERDSGQIWGRHFCGNGD